MHRASRDLNTIDKDGDHIVIGCGVTHSQIVKDAHHQYGNLPV